MMASSSTHAEMNALYRFKDCPRHLTTSKPKERRQ